jgi:hypothetical protein
LAALFSNLGGTFVGMHGIHKAPFLALSNYCCGQKSDSAAALAQPLLQDREERQEAAIEHPELTPRQKFTAGIEMAKALIEVLEAAAAGSGKAAERDFGRATFESPLGSAFYQARIQHYQEAVRRASVFEDLEE